MINGRIGGVLRLLRTIGFIATGNRAGIRYFEGTLPCTKGSVRVQLKVSDWNFLHYPSISILERPSFLSGLIPHVDTVGELCYFAPGSVVLDRYDPVTAINQCLSQATLLLNQISSDPLYRITEIQNEFLAYWKPNQSPHPWPVYIGTIDSRTIYSNCFLFNKNNREYAIIADKHDEANTFVQTLGDSPLKFSCNCWIFRTNKLPAVPQETMPGNIKQLFAWLYQWDRVIYNEIKLMLGKNTQYLSHPIITFAVSSPIGWVGFGFYLDKMKRRYYQRFPKLYKRYLQEEGGAEGIFRLSITDISPSFVHSRNLSFPDLRDRRITLIGCGAIGGYLAQSLVRLGAGLGTGVLILFDPDLLRPENLGRHYLGYPNLFQSKAKAVRDDLFRQFPLAHIEAHCENVALDKKLFSVDLVIDATGEESVSEMLNGVRNVFGHQPCPLLHVWIKGNGECIQSFWTDKSEYGCFRCLRMADVDNYRQERFPVLNNAPERRFVGCHAFTPYAISAPMHAASLAIDAIIDWIKGDPSPRFRTRFVENVDIQHGINQNISRLKGCPACSHQ